MDEMKKNVSKLQIMDYVITALVLISLFGLIFCWKCGVDIWVTILGFVVVVSGTLLLGHQNRILKNLMH